MCTALANASPPRPRASPIGFSMRLCYVAYSPLDLQSANSIQTFSTVSELSRQLGDNLLTIVPRFGSETPPPFPFKRIGRIPVNKISKFFPSAWYSYIERILYAERAKRIARAHHPDLIYTRDSVCAYRFIRANFPVLYEVHDLESQHPGRAKSPHLKQFLERMDETILTRARGIASLTETFRQEIIARNWQPASRVFVIPDAYDAAIYFPRDQQKMRDALQLPANAHIVTYAGLTFKYRGLDVLLHAFKAWNDPNALLVLIGGRPFEVTELKTFSAELGIADRVQFVERKPAPVIAQYLAAADALVIPDTVTDATASPLKMFEYMAMARPIVCVDRPALREIMGDTALYFPRGDATALAQSLALALQSPISASRIPAQLQSSVRVIEFTYARRAEKILLAAQKVLSS